MLTAVLRLTAALGSAMLLSTAATAGELHGAPATLGEGTVTTYALMDASGAPLEIGVVLSAGALDGLPAEPNQTSRCFDLDGDAAIGSTECEGDHEIVLALPDLVASRDDIPFEWVMLNWNSHGHAPAAWSAPHFDLHFYSVPKEVVAEMGPGPCGFFMDCAAFERAIVPVPPKYLHPDFIDVNAAVAGMGNHLIDSKTPELGDPPVPFTHTWIFGAYDGRIIFHEVMMTRDFLAGADASCTEIKQPQAYQQAGYYPARYCFRPGPDGSVRVYMDRFTIKPAG